MCWRTLVHALGHWLRSTHTGDPTTLVTYASTHVARNTQLAHGPFPSSQQRIAGARVASYVLTR